MIHDYRKSATKATTQSVRSWTDEQLLMEINYDALILDHSSAPPGGLADGHTVSTATGLNFTNLIWVVNHFVRVSRRPITFLSCQHSLKFTILYS